MSSYTPALYNMSDIPGLVIRPALLSDYTGVMELDNSTWHKLDYLPALYSQLLDDPSANCFVAEISGKVVGFYNLQTSEQDTVAVSVAQRVHVDYQRRGIATALKKTALDGVSKQGIVLKTCLRKTLSSEYTERKLLDPTNAERVIYKLKVVGLCTTYESVSNGLQDYNHTFGSDDTIHSFSDDKTAELLTSSDAMSSIFTHDFFSASDNWFPFRCTPDKIKSMIASHKVFCSTDISATVCNATSYGTFLLTENGPRYTFFFYPKAGSQHLFLPHAQKHLSHFLNLARGSESVTFSIETPAEYCENTDIGIFVQMFGVDVQVGWNTDLLVLEEKLNSY